MKSGRFKPLTHCRHLVLVGLSSVPGAFTLTPPLLLDRPIRRRHLFTALPIANSLTCRTDFGRSISHEKHPKKIKK